MMKKTLLTICFLCLFASSAFATEISIASVEIPNWRHGGANVKMRAFPNTQFQTSDAKIIPAGSITSNAFYKQTDCTLAGTTLTCAGFEGSNKLDSTTDSNVPTAGYTFIVFEGNTRRLTYLSDMRLPHTLGTTITFAQIQTYNLTAPRPPTPNYPTMDMVSALVAGVPIPSKSSLGLGNVDNTSDANKPLSNAVNSALALKQNASEKGQANGFASLDSSGKIPLGQIPPGLEGLPTNIKVANLFPGADIGAKINAADAACGTGACEIWVYGNGTITTQVIINQFHTVRQFAGTIEMGVLTVANQNAVHILLKNNTSWIGTSWNSVLKEQSTPGCATEACRYGIILAYEAGQRDQLISSGQYYANRTENIHVKGVHFLGQPGNGSDSGNAKTIQMGNCRNCSVTHNWFDNTSAYAAEFGSRSESGNYAENCYFTDNIVEYLLSQNVAVINAENVFIERNIFRNPGKKPTVITSVTKASGQPITVNTSTLNTANTGMTVSLQDVLGIGSAYNTSHTVTKVDGDTFTLNGTSGMTLPAHLDHNIPMTITSISNASPRVVTIAEPRNLATGTLVSISGVVNSSAPYYLLEGLYQITNISPTQFSLNGTTAGAAYTSGGTARKAVRVTGLTNASPNVVTISENLDLQTGMEVSLSGVVYRDASLNPVAGQINGSATYKVTRISANSFSLDGSANYPAVNSTVLTDTFLVVKSEPLAYVHNQQLVVIDIEPNGNTLSSGERVRNVTIRNNLIDARKTQSPVNGIYLQIVGAGLANDTNVISDNIILGPSAADRAAGNLLNCISTKDLPYANNLTIKDNVCKNYAQIGITVFGDKLDVSGNELEDGAINGVVGIRAFNVTNSKFSNNRVVKTIPYGGVIEERGTNIGNTWTNNEAQYLTHHTTSTVTNSIYRNNIFIGTTLGGLVESTNSNSNLFDGNLTLKTPSGDNYGFVKVGSLSKVLTAKYSDGSVWTPQPVIPTSTKTGNYTLTAADNGTMIIVNSASAVTITVPAGLGVGFNCLVVQKGAGQVTFFASGTTLNNRLGQLKTAGQFSTVTLASYETNTFTVAGDTGT